MSKNEIYQRDFDSVCRRGVQNTKSAKPGSLAFDVVKGHLTTRIF